MSRSLGVQLRRFLVVGTCTVAVDFVVYQLLLLLAVPVHVAKASSFVVATILAYLLNRHWTFGSPGGSARALGFAALYSGTLLVNVSVNGVALDLLPRGSWRVELAFLCAQACSTTLNFVMMRYVVFAAARPGARDGRATRRALLEPSRD